MDLNERVATITPSLTLAVDAKAKAMLAAGAEVCAFGAGEPDFDTPAHIKEAAIQALRDGKTKYAPNAGVAELRAAIADKLKRDNRLDYTPDQILVGNGGKHTLFTVFMTLLRPGDEVLIPAPYWLSYPEMVNVAGGRPVFVAGPEAQQLKVTAADLERHLTPRTRVLVINSPSNPSGVAYTEAELRELAQVAVRHNLWIVADEIYEKMIYDGLPFVSTGALNPEIFERTITANGFSKTYAMTGWRLGYIAGPKKVIQAAGALQSHSTSAPNTFAQYGALAALRGPQDCVAQMIRAFAERREYLFGRLRAMPGIRCTKPAGAFYVFPNIADSGLNSLAFTERILDAEKVAVVPGLPFGADAHIRLSYACGLNTIREGMDRLERFLGALRR
jgi:aspartate aminotransferase